MTTAANRPDPRCCTTCGATEGGCEAARTFRGRPCCEACNHDHDREAA